MVTSQPAARLARPEGHLRPAVWGASGFAVGGFTSGLALHAVIHPALQMKGSVLFVLLLNAAFLVFGAIGGAASALAVRMPRRLASPRLPEASPSW